MTKQAQPNDGKSRKFFRDIVIGLLIDGFKGLIILIITFVIGSAILNQWLLNLWPAIIVGILLTVLVLFFSKSWTTIRWKKLMIYTEVSAAKRSNDFTELAKYIFRRRNLVEQGLAQLREIASLRRHPNRAVTQQIEQLIVDKNIITDDERKSILRFLENINPAKKIIRTQVTQNMAGFLRDVDQRTFIVLYGYSTTVCESIASVYQRLPAPILIVEDLQYPGSNVKEHEKVKQHLLSSGIDADVIKFEDTLNLCSPSATFIRHLDGKGMTPLPEKRRMLALIGCEAADVDGNVLIPSRRDGKSSETAFFKELFTKKEADETLVTRQIAVVSESYKVLENFDEDDLNLGSPVSKNVFREFIYLLGFENVLRHQSNKLVKMKPSEISAIIDDTGIHLAQNGIIDLRSSFQKWRKLTNQSLPSFMRINAGLILRESDIIIFDMNGILVDDEPEHYEAFAYAVRENGENLTYQEYLQKCSGLSDLEGALNLIRAKNIKLNTEDFLALKQKRYLQQIIDTPPIFHRTVELVEKLSLAGKDCYLVTSTPLYEVERFLNSNNFLKEKFDDNHKFSDVKSEDRKFIYRRIMMNADNPGRCVVIDDSPINLRIARELGIKTVGIASTHSVESFDAADATSPSPDELVTLYETSSIPYNDGKGMLIIIL